MDSLSELESLTLSLPDKNGKPPRPSRLTSANAIRTLYSEAIRDDESSAITRARIQAMVDGAPPYNQAALNAMGQGSRANANFLMGQDLVNRACNGLLDILTSPKQLMTIEVEGGEPSERLGYSRIIASELTRTIRKWRRCQHATQSLIRHFVTHGVAIDYAPDDRDFRFEVAGLGEFLLPRQVEATEDRVPWAIARKEMIVTELYESIEDEEVAKKLGWNVDAVRAAIGRASTKASNGEIGEIEKLQSQIKNNDLMASGRQFEHVVVLHGWVREFDGSISYVIVEKDAPGGDFLFKRYSRYPSVEEAFTFYCYGVGNGKLHSVRGLGHMIFALVQLHNRLMCQKADGVMLAESIMVQASSGQGLQEATVNYLGPLSLLSPGLDVVERQFTGGTDRTMTFMGEVKSLMGQTSSQFMANTEGGGTYKNRDAQNFEMESYAGNDSGTVDLFYPSWDLTMRRMCKRIVKGPKSDPLVAEFHRRVAKAGITQEILDSIDHDSTYAYRALGAGSPAARSLAFTKLMSLLPQLDEIGRKNLIYQFVANEVGYQNADEFASKAEEPRYNTEASLALLENTLLLMGEAIPVLSYQMHATHVQLHIPVLLQTLDAVERGEIDPMEKLPGLQASLDHLAAHGEELAQDSTQAALYGQVKEAVNNLQQVVTNMERRLKAEQRKGAEETATMEPGSQDALAAEKIRQEQLKTALIELKADLAQRKGELELAMIQAKANQNLALNDLKGAEAVKKQMQYPRSDYSQRR